MCRVMTFRTRCSSANAPHSASSIQWSEAPALPGVEFEHITGSLGQIPASHLEACECTLALSGEAVTHDNTAHISVSVANA
jgi:hypothetical protein